MTNATTLRYFKANRDLGTPVGTTRKGAAIFAYIMPSTGETHLLTAKTASGKGATLARRVKVAEIDEITRKFAEAEAAEFERLAVLNDKGAARDDAKVAATGEGLNGDWFRDRAVRLRAKAAAWLATTPAVA